MKRCYVSLSFDDGREDNYRNAFKILKKYNLLATIHIISGYIDGTYQGKLASSNGAIDLDNLREMKKYGCEISLHGDKHITEYYDFECCQKKAKKWRLLERQYGFSVPHSKEEILKDTILANKMRKDLEYVRVGKNNAKIHLFQKAMYFLYLVTKFKIFYWEYNKVNIINYMKNIDYYHLVSIPVKKNDCAKKIEYVIKKSTNDYCWVILMFHSVLKKDDKLYNDSKWGYDYNEFEKLCSSLEKMQKNGRIKVLPIIDVIKEVKRNV